MEFSCFHIPSTLHSWRSAHVSLCLSRGLALWIRLNQVIHFLTRTGNNPVCHLQTLLLANRTQPLIPFLHAFLHLNTVDWLRACHHTMPLEKWESITFAWGVTAMDSPWYLITTEVTWNGIPPRSVTCYCSQYAKLHRLACSTFVAAQVDFGRADLIEVSNTTVEDWELKRLDWVSHFYEDLVMVALV